MAHSARSTADSPSVIESSQMQFGFMFFSSGEQSLGRDKYRLAIESARFADAHEFTSLWLPERHFTDFGCLYPSPAVLHAAIARETQRVRLRAGSIVLPLHDPIRVAEEWAVVDNLSGGRVDVSFASGWNPGDFVLAPNRYRDRHQTLFEDIETVRQLWRGESLNRTGGNGQATDLRIYPTPVQPDLPIWVTAASNPQTFIQAGAIGANVLTHLFDGGVDTLAEKISLYRQARSQHGYDPETGKVTVALHTFVGETLEGVRQQVRDPYCAYLKSHAHLLEGLSYSRGIEVKVSSLSDADLDSLAKLVFEKFFDERRALLGTPESCSGLVRQLANIGVAEVACLLDFGPDVDSILHNLPHLDRLRQACQTSRLAPHNNGAIHLQADRGPDNTIDEIQQRCVRVLGGSEFYQQLKHQGVKLGSSFQGIERLWRGNGEAIAEVRLPESLRLRSAHRHCQSHSGYGIHPAFLDACLQVFLASLPLGDGVYQYLPVGLENLRIIAPLSDRVWSHARLRSPSQVGAAYYEGNVCIFDTDGQRLLMEITGIRLQQASASFDVPKQSAPLAPDDWFYQIQWQAREELQPAPHGFDPQAIGNACARSAIAARARAQLARKSSQQSLARYREFLPKLQTLSVEYVLATLQTLGGIPEPGQTVSIAQLGQACRVIPAHSRLFQRLLQIASEVGVLETLEDDRIRVRRFRASNSQALLQRLQAQYSEFGAELDLLTRCAEALTEVLQGGCDPLTVLFPDGSVSSVERIYQDSPAARVVNQLLEQAIATAISDFRERRPIRILEIGAGTGGTTASILPQLQGRRSEYVFTDVSPLFVQKAAQKFAAYPFIEYRSLDIERNPQEQGLAPGHFDLVLAANVLHATADLGQSLQHIRSLLAPEGLLVLLEGIQPQPWLDLIFGLTEGWWRFTDTHLRPDYPLLSASGWRSLLQHHDFAAVETVAVGHDDEAQCQQALVLAKWGKPAPQPWLLVSDRGGIGEALTARLQQRGDNVVAISANDAREAIPSHPYRGILYLAGLDATNPAADDTTVARVPWQLLRALETHESLANVPIWWVTRGGQCVHSDDALAVSQSMLWGLGKSLAAERPQRRIGLVDLDPQADPHRAAKELLAALGDSNGESAIAFRQGTSYVPRLCRQPLENEQRQLDFSRGSYLIAGGLGDLGLLVAGWLVDRGAQHLILLGRSPLPERDTWANLSADSRAGQQVAAIQALESRGACVSLAVADLSNFEQLEAEMARIRHDGCPPVRGVFHLAAIAQPLTSFNELDAVTLAEVLRPKVLGSWNLHRLFEDDDLECFVLFSSWSSLLGSVGQKLGGYSMANAFLDTLAHYRTSRGRPGLSINWGDWAEIGMRARYVRQGYRLLPEQWTLAPEAGLQALDRLLHSPVLTQVAVLPVPWSQFFQLFPETAAQPFLEAVQLPQERSTPKPEPDRAWLQQLHQLPLVTRQSRLHEYVGSEVARIIQLPDASQLDCQRGLFELGIDSLMALELKNRLETDLGLTIPLTAIFDRSSVNALCAYIASDLLGWKSDTPAPTTENDSLDVDRLAQLSDAEIDRLFAAKTQNAKVDQL